MMEQALACAQQAMYNGEVPVGAVIADPEKQQLLAQAHNLTLRNCDPTAHAEVVAIRAVAALRKSPHLDGLDLYTTLEPCAMCAAAASFARIRRIVFGAADSKGGAVMHGPRFFEQSTCHHRPEWVCGVMEPACRKLLVDFFAQRRSDGISSP